MMRARILTRLLLLGALASAVAILASAEAQTLLLTLDTPNPQAVAYFGYSVAVGDVNGDGKGDIAVGAYGEDVGGNDDAGRAYAFSGADSSLLLTLDTPNPQVSAQFGYSVAVGDVNGDGKRDIAVVAPFEDVGGNADQGRAYVFSGSGPVGGIAELPELDAAPVGAGGSSGVSVGQVACVAALAAAAGLSLGGAAWYVRRRRLS
jgi:hypothetical protein